MVTHVLRAASDCAASAGGAEQVANFPIQRRGYLAHGCFIMGSRIGQVGILIGPETVFTAPQEMLDTVDPRLKKLPSNRIRLGDNIDLGPIGLKNANVLLCRLRIYYADKS